MTARQVNLALEAMILLAVGTGLTSWAIGTEWSRVATVLHAIVGLTLLVLMPAKLRGSVRTGMKRGRATRWLSATFGVMVLVTIGLGLAHATGLWFGVGYWSALWTHFLAAFALLPLLAWHIYSRPVRPRVADLDRRALLGGGAAITAAAVVVAGQEVAVRAAGLAGGHRRFTGSHEIASFDPANMPRVSWIDDKAPRVAREDWELRVLGQPVDLDELAADTAPVEATVDCTGGWYSRQSWDCVALTDLLGDSGGRSIVVTSATGYRRLFPRSEADNVYLAVGYGGQPLQRGHGAPVRVVAPGRRGPWWIKWVSYVEVTDRPSWLQLPFPAT